MLRQHARERNQAEFVLHFGFYRAQSTKKGTDMRAVPVEGTLSKRGKSFEGVWGNFLESFPTKKIPTKKISPKHQT